MLKSSLQKSPVLPPAPLQARSLFSDVSQRKEAVSQRRQRGSRGRRGRFISVFQKEVNNKYSLTCQQHNICSVTLRWRTEAEALLTRSNIKARDHEKATRGCTVFHKQPKSVFSFHIPQTKFSEHNGATRQK